MSKRAKASSTPVVLAGRRLISCRRAAMILGVSMPRVRQLGQVGELWCVRPCERALLFDELEVRKFARVRQAARDAGRVPGPPPGGFRSG